MIIREKIIIRDDSPRRIKPDVGPVSPVEEEIFLLDVGIVRVLTLILYVGVVERRGTMLLTVVHPYQSQVRLRGNLVLTIGRQRRVIKVFCRG